MIEEVSHSEFLQEIANNQFYIKKITEILNHYNFSWSHLWILLENTREFFDKGNHLYDLSYKNLKEYSNEIS